MKYVYQISSSVVAGKPAAKLAALVLDRLHPQTILMEYLVGEQIHNQHHEMRGYNDVDQKVLRRILLSIAQECRRAGIRTGCLGVYDDQAPLTYYISDTDTKKEWQVLLVSGGAAVGIVDASDFQSQRNFASGTLYPTPWPSPYRAYSVAAFALSSGGRRWPDGAKIHPCAEVLLVCRDELMERGLLNEND